MTSRRTPCVRRIRHRASPNHEPLIGNHREGHPHAEPIWLLACSTSASDVPVSAAARGGEFTELDQAKAVLCSTHVDTFGSHADLGDGIFGSMFLVLGCADFNAMGEIVESLGARFPPPCVLTSSTTASRDRSFLS
jgi:hypothetical protein